jgi:IS30 family transposase
MLSYSHFTIEERKCLEKFIKENCSKREIARRLDRSPSSITREIKRNQNKNGTYNHWRANSLYIYRRRESNRKRQNLIPNTPEWDYIVEKLSLFWSPEEIVMRYYRDYQKKLCAVSTIYRYIRLKKFPKITAKNNLRRRGKAKYSRNSNFNTIHPDRIIPEWTEAIKNRIRIGDWEGDTVYGSPGQGLAVTLVDRKTRYLLSGLLEKKTAEMTEEVIVNLLNGMPVKSVSLDNGSEFANFASMEKKLKAPFYFAEPHKPWQRGTNENTNDILRFFFPKGTNFHNITQEELDYAVFLINTRPRKCLNWLSPFEVFWGVALA